MATSSKTNTHPWWKDVVCYQIWPKSFMDSNGDGQGDIRGIMGKLDYLEGLGIDVIWISPMYTSPMVDYGYDVADWRGINPQFGSMKDMETLIQLVHQRGMKILLDLVISHTSDQHEWFLESKSSKKNPKRDWYIWKDGRKDGKKIYNEVSGVVDRVKEPTNWRACFGGSTWTSVPERDQYYLHLFLPQQPDLNWENKETRAAIFDNAVGYWLDKGIDGFRMDCGNRMSKDPKFRDAETKLEGKLQPATEFFINRPKCHEYLKEMRKYMDNHPSVKKGHKELMIVGELPKASFDDVLKYTHPKSRELDMIFDFDMVSLGGHDDPDNVPAHKVKNLSDGDPTFTLPKFKATLLKMQNLIKSGAWATVFMENHDQCRSINRYATPDSQYHQAAAKLLCLLQTTLSGTQFIYQGQEIGMLDMPSDWDYEDFHDPAAKRYMDDEEKKGGKEAREQARIGNLKFGRDNARTPMQWSKGMNADFSTCQEGYTWIAVNPNKDTINFESQQHQEDSIWNFWRRQIKLRKEDKDIFMHGSFEILDMGNEKTFTYVKTSPLNDDRMAVVCLNFSGEQQPLVMPKDVELVRRLLVFEVGTLGKPADIRMALRPWEGRMYILPKRV